MDAWHPLMYGSMRRGRSASGFAYPRQPMGPVIRTKHRYAFADSLLHQNLVTKRLEDKDPSYRGELDPKQSCVGITYQLGDYNPEPESDTEPESEEPSSPVAFQLPDSDSLFDSDSESDGVAPSSPATHQLPDDDSLFNSDSESKHEAPSSPVARAAPGPVPPSPTLTELLGPTLSRPPVERLSSPFTPAPPRAASLMDELFGPSPSPVRQPLITYAKRDRLRTRKVAASNAKAKVAASKAQKKHRRKASRSTPSRRSRRLRRGRVGDLSEWGVVDAEELLDCPRFELHELTDNLPRALVDRQDIVMAVAAPGPKEHGEWWTSVIARAEQDLGRLYRNGSFAHLRESESLVRFGMTFGYPWGCPFAIDNLPANEPDVLHIQASLAFKALSDYQNMLYQQFAPVSHAQVGTRMDELVRRDIALPPFPNSVFTTAEITFCDAPMIARKNTDAAFDTMEAVTSIGSYDHKKGGHIVFTEDDVIIELPPGTTVLLPAGTKWYKFAAVGKHEHRYLFRQFCSAGVLRWVDKGGRSDKLFDNEASAEVRAAWNEMREKRGIKSFSKVGDIYVC